MGYQSSNAAYAYDMRAESYASDYYRSSAAPQVEQRPRLDVVTGAGREANQSVSPVFTSVVKPPSACSRRSSASWAWSA